MSDQASNVSVQIDVIYDHFFAVIISTEVAANWI
jgi:hypothetical protein